MFLFVALWNICYAEVYTCSLFLWSKFSGKHVSSEEEGAH